MRFAGASYRQIADALGLKYTASALRYIPKGLGYVQSEACRQKNVRNMAKARESRHMLRFNETKRPLPSQRGTGNTIKDAPRNPVKAAALDARMNVITDIDRLITAGQFAEAHTLAVSSGMKHLAARIAKDYNIVTEPKLA